MTLQELIYRNQLNGRVMKVKQTPLITRYYVDTQSPQDFIKNKDLFTMYFGPTSVEYGNQCIHVDVLKANRPDIGIKSVLRECQAFEYPIGINQEGQALIDSLRSSVNCLVVGQPGSGKSICLNSIICGLAALNTPYALRFVLMDFKFVEFEVYKNLPHLMYPVVNDIDLAVTILKELNYKMEQRYQKLMLNGVRNIDEYNDKGHCEPRIVVVIDEMADMMLKDSSVESVIQSIAQKGRACGIHLILATQTPRKDVVSGIIKLCVPTTIAFRVRSKTDSRVAIDASGCEELLGKGDGLYCSADGQKTRFQGCMVSDSEVLNLVNALAYDYQFAVDEINLEESEDEEVEEVKPKYTEEEMHIMEVIHQEKLSCRAIMERFRVGNDKSQRLRRASVEVFG